MGLGKNTTKLLCMLKRKNLVNYENTLTLGRQELNLNKRTIRALYSAYGDVLSTDQIRGKYSEKFFAALGSKKTDSMDASKFEGATILHDLNKPVSQDMVERYTCIVDGGTTEHIFDFPTAMKNIMKMLKVGGVYIGMVPSNQWNGHGFYQFSAMLYIQLFCKNNHFQLKKIYFSDGSRMWELLDKDVSKRIEMVSHKPLEIYVVAKKISRIENDEIVLQQGDYIEKWDGRIKVSKLKKLAMSLPYEVQWRLKHLYSWLMQKKQLKRIRL